MDKISGLTSKVLAGKKLNKAAQAAFVCHLTKKVLKDFFDKEFLKETRILSFKEAKLYFLVPNSTYAQEIKLKENQILKEINNHLGGEIVNKIRFKNSDSNSK